MKRSLLLLRNKYLIVTVIVGVWIFFLDRNDVFVQYEYAKRVKDLDEKKQFYIQEIKQIKSDIDAIASTEEHLEKFAREKYLMKRPSEDIFVVLPQKK